MTTMSEGVTRGNRPSPYLLEGAGGSQGQAALHQVVPQLPQVQQLLLVVLHRGRNLLCQQADGEHRLHLRALLTLTGSGNNCSHHQND